MATTFLVRLEKYATHKEGGNPQHSHTKGISPGKAVAFSNKSLHLWGPMKTAKADSRIMGFTDSAQLPSTTSKECSGTTSHWPAKDMQTWRPQHKEFISMILNITHLSVLYTSLVSAFILSPSAQLVVFACILHIKHLTVDRYTCQWQQHFLSTQGLRRTCWSPTVLEPEHLQSPSQPYSHHDNHHSTGVDTAPCYKSLLTPKPGPYGGSVSEVNPPLGSLANRLAWPLLQSTTCYWNSMVPTGLTVGSTSSDIYFWYLFDLALNVKKPCSNL